MLRNQPYLSHISQVHVIVPSIIVEIVAQNVGNFAGSVNNVSVNMAESLRNSAIVKLPVHSIVRERESIRTLSIIYVLVRYLSNP